MAYTALTIQTVTSSGLTPSFTAPSGTGAGEGWSVTNDGSTYIRILNTNAATRTITFKASGSFGGEALVDKQVTLGATTGDMTFKLPVERYGGTIYIEVSATAGVTGAAFK
jgi:hypothetical protein